MQLILILLGIVSILTCLSGIIMFFGSAKKDRGKSFWFFLAAIFATVWMISISLFKTATSPEVLDQHTIWTFISAIFLDYAFLGYASWGNKFSKPLLGFFGLYGLIVAVAILVSPHSMYQDAMILNSGNSATILIAPLFIAYVSYFGLIVPAILTTYLKQLLKTRSLRMKNSDIVTMVGFGVSSTVVMICDLILPLLGYWNIGWLGPIALALTIIAVYYTILRYRSLNLSSIWLRIFSYIIIFATISIIYVAIFALIFAALFRGSMPSIEVIVLNFIMITLFMILSPAINKLIQFIHYYTSTKDNKEDTKKVEK